VTHDRAAKRLAAAVGAISLLAASAAVAQSPPPIAPQLPPPTAAFDGYYEKPIVTTVTAGCPALGPLPVVSISNGLAVFHAPTFFFQGQVTPQGALSMRSNSLAFDGQIDPQFVLTANISGPNCAYHVTWNRVVVDTVAAAPAQQTKELPPGSVTYPVHFPTGGVTLGPEDQETIRGVASKMMNSPSLFATIIGKADTVGSSDLNERIAEKRAQAVFEALVYTNKVPETRVAVRWTGEHVPVVSTADEQAEMQNRVVAIIVQ